MQKMLEVFWALEVIISFLIHYAWNNPFFFKPDWSKKPTAQRGLEMKAGLLTPYILNANFQRLIPFI